MLLVAETRTLKLPLKLIRATSTIRFVTNPFFLFNFCYSTCAESEEQEKNKKELTHNLFLHDISKTMATNLNDYKIIKEGEAEILMHAKNEVFYNKAQV